MAKTETKIATAVELELPPAGGNLSVISTLEEDAHYLRVTLDKSENFKVAVGVKLQDLLVNQFSNNRNALRDWYETNVAEGKAHRAWQTVEKYLGTVLKHGPNASEIFAERDERQREWNRDYYRQRRDINVADNTTNTNNDLGRDGGTYRPAQPSEYDQRATWLSDMNHQWFKGKREWQDRWLKDRSLSRNRGPI
jgi:hypothetical protein